MFENFSNDLIVDAAREVVKRTQKELNAAKSELDSKIAEYRELKQKLERVSESMRIANSIYKDIYQKHQNQLSELEEIELENEEVFWTSYPDDDDDDDDNALLIRFYVSCPCKQDEDEDEDEDEDCCGAPVLVDEILVDEKDVHFIEDEVELDDDDHRYFRSTYFSQVKEGHASCIACGGSFEFSRDDLIVFL